MKRKNILPSVLSVVITIIYSTCILAQQEIKTEYEYNSTNYLPSQIKRSHDGANEKIEYIEYAFEQSGYSGMQNLNMLSQVYRKTISNYSETCLNRSTSEWELINNAWRLKALKKYSSDTDGNITISDFEYDTYGNIISDTDTDGIVTRYIYGYNHSKLVGIAKNCGTEQAIVDDFNDGSISDSDPVLWTTSYQTVDSILQLGPGQETGISQAYLKFNLDVQIEIPDVSSNGYGNILFGNGYTLLYANKINTITQEPENWLILLYNDAVVRMAKTGKSMDGFRRLGIKAEGNKISIYLDGQCFIDNCDTPNFTAGQISLKAVDIPIYYDNFRLYPYDALMTSYAYDNLTLDYIEKIDENLVSTYFEYDGLGRLSNVKKLHDGDINLVSENSYSYSRDNYTEYEPTYPNKIVTKTYSRVDGSYPLETVQYFDGLGRKIQEQSIGSSDIILNTYFTYDDMGRAKRTYKPYQDNLANGYVSYQTYEDDCIDYYEEIQLENHDNTSNDNDYPYSENEYCDDPLNRISKQGFPGDLWNINSSHTKRYTYSLDGNNDLKETLTDEQDNVTVTYKDDIGRVVKTVRDPNGLNLVTQFKYDNLDRLYETRYPLNYLTSMTYNSLNQVVEKSTPDAGTSAYLYDEFGNLRFIKDANHTGSSFNSFTTSETLYGTTSSSSTFTMPMPGIVKLYIKTYDEVTNLNETINLKITNVSSNQVILEDITAEDDASPTIYKKIKLPKGSYNYEVVTSGETASQFYYYVYADNNIIMEYNKYDDFKRLIENGEYYSSNDDNFDPDLANTPGFPFTKLYINSQFIYDNPSSDVLASGQRNLKGRLSEERAYRLNELAFTRFYSYDAQGNIEWVVNKWVSGKNNKIKNHYDLQGRITKTEFLGGSTIYDIYKFYEYDQLGRLVASYTADNVEGNNKVKEAEYSYFADGKVKRMELGDDGDKAQGVDYLYNARGWLTQINHQNLNSSDDPGDDGANGIPVDKFGEVIGYNNVSSHIGGYQGATAQFSGNISWLMYKMYGVSHVGSLVGYTFDYDNANRLTGADFGKYESGWQTTDAYDVRNLSYDANGNISNVQRYWDTGVIIDDHDMYYYDNTNRLKTISDYSQYPDLTDTDVDYQDAVNYLYNDNGNMIQDTQAGIGFILYDTKNMPLKIYKTNGEVYEYVYDVSGNRVRNVQTGFNYAYGPDGKVESRIKENGYPPTWIKHNLYGLDNIGFIDKTQYYTYEEVKNYYLKDHLGSIKVRVDENGNVTGYDDYYPFGMSMNGRSASIGTAETYKFTGKERDTETGLDYFGARYYDCKIGRWFNIDPLADKYPGWSPYNYTLNNPLRFIDPDGNNVDTAKTAHIVKDKKELEKSKAEFNNAWENGNVWDIISAGFDVVVDATVLNWDMATLVQLPAFSVINAGAQTSAKLVTNGVRLSKQLASKAQMVEKGKVIVAGDKLRAATRLIKQYGGKAGEWVKKTSSSFSKNGVKFETHWYENLNSGIRVEFKTKLIQLGK